MNTDNRDKHAKTETETEIGVEVGGGVARERAALTAGYAQRGRQQHENVISQMSLSRPWTFRHLTASACL